MRLTKLGHACVRLDVKGVRLVIDPGSFSGPDLLTGANAVLITHEHFDHVDADLVRAAVAADPDLTVWTNHAVAGQLDLGDRVRTVAHGDTFDVGGVDVHVYGEKHAALHPDVEPPVNVGFRVAGEVFHPGDALTVPEDPTPTLLAPTNAPWLRGYDLYLYVRQFAPKRLFSIHDGLVNDIGLIVVDNLIAGLAKETGGEGKRLPVGTTIDL